MTRITLPNPTAQIAFGQRLARLIPAHFVINLEGDLGTGKTTLTRGVLRGLGYQGTARSPTYTLLEPYELTTRTLYHLDLYRLGDPRELDDLGLRDLMAEPAIWMVEWPERGRGMLPPCDLTLAIDYCGQGRAMLPHAHTARAREVLAALLERSPAQP
ncbi:tRNA (adenosine(37)-N6)-threonylcarbamoyltransferase complex ATPase subunit type 1 TsaE [Thiocapsa imhoffii]|uniref:tRNA threonylcarbamoyladenosine biosynthesis protein TsaE n=1 Tax=Thiocapsa imhoffii TaxID=382777 RepID=A0A9X0WIE4_9GAMM|nr:tRNA (adenosine(37)-N6)-threonylcarbamoyltransferase complex ATPase subunit type 1 TsaE [Thiocapsa imhoffii]MBK1645327.1 tRNA (adenosine(37)-N6)-threonylcarbamoyltransferase complex ATPase subunit type 1 TsaE [Thiocapsa imhoffii]